MSAERAGWNTADADSAGEISGCVHDGALTGIRLEGDHAVTLEVLTADLTSRVELRMCGLYRFVAHEFVNGNIVLDIDVEHLALTHSEELAELLGASSDSPHLRTTLESLIDEKRMFVSVNPSIGCSAMCICSALEWRVLAVG